MKWVAEIGSNHNASLKRGLDLIDVASEIGFDAVKFQYIRVSDIFAQCSSIMTSSELAAWSAREVPLDWVAIWSNAAHSKGLEFGITVFQPETVEVLRPYASFFKVASYSLLYKPLLHALGKSSRPVVVSTGMATYAEVSDAVSVLYLSSVSELTLLHCVSKYPALPTDVNLKSILALKSLCPKVGYSDHTCDRRVIYKVVYTYRVDMIELHFDLDNAGFESKYGHCWTPDQVESLFEDFKVGSEADGVLRKEPSPGEVDERNLRADPEDGLRPLRGYRRCNRAYCGCHSGQNGLQ